VAGVAPQRMVCMRACAPACARATGSVRMPTDPPASQCRTAPRGHSGVPRRTARRFRTDESAAVVHPRAAAVCLLCRFGLHSRRRWCARVRACAFARLCAQFQLELSSAHRVGHPRDLLRTGQHNNLLSTNICVRGAMPMGSQAHCVQIDGRMDRHGRQAGRRAPKAGFPLRFTVLLHGPTDRRTNVAAPMRGCTEIACRRHCSHARRARRRGALTARLHARRVRGAPRATCARTSSSSRIRRNSSARSAARSPCAPPRAEPSRRGNSVDQFPISTQPGVPAPTGADRRLRTARQGRGLATNTTTWQPTDLGSLGGADAGRLRLRHKRSATTRERSVQPARLSRTAQQSRAER
jgi:hypothetical protein